METNKGNFSLPKPGDPGRNAGATERLAKYMQQLSDKGELTGYSFFLADNREANPDDFAAAVHSLLKSDMNGECQDITEMVLQGGL